MRVLVLAVALSMTAAVTAHPASPRCQAPQDARVLARTSLSVVWEDRSEVVACLRSGSRVIVDPNSEDEDVRAWLTGRFVALATQFCDPKEEDRSCRYTHVSVWDLRSRRLVSARSYDDVNGDDVYAQLDDLKLTSRGATVLLLKVAANREVWLLCSRGAERVAAAQTIAPRLRETRRFVRWTDSATGEQTGIRPTCRPPASR